MDLLWALKGLRAVTQRVQLHQMGLTAMVHLATATAPRVSRMAPTLRLAAAEARLYRVLSARLQAAAPRTALRCLTHEARRPQGCVVAVLAQAATLGVAQVALQRGCHA